MIVLIVGAPVGGELLPWQKQFNQQVNSLRASVERAIANLKTWRVLHTDYRRSCSTYREAYDAARGLFFFSITWGFE